MTRYNGDLNIIIGEFNKLPKKHKDLLDLREKWCYFLYHSTSLSEEARKNLSQHEELKMAIRDLDQLQKDKQLHQRALDREMSMVAFRLDQQGLLEKGMAKGKAEEQLAIAKRLLENNVSLPTISTATGLSITDLMRLK